MTQDTSREPASSGIAPIRNLGLYPSGAPPPDGWVATCGRVYWREMCSTSSASFITHPEHLAKEGATTASRAHRGRQGFASRMSVTPATGSRTRWDRSRWAVEPWIRRPPAVRFRIPMAWPRAASGGSDARAVRRAAGRRRHRRGIVPARRRPRRRQRQRRVPTALLFATTDARSPEAPIVGCGRGHARGSVFSWAARSSARA